MDEVVWWEIETPAPERFQEFHGSLWGWTFEAAFAARLSREQEASAYHREED